MVAELGERSEGLLTERVDAAADPNRKLRGLLEARDEIVLAQLDEAERRARVRDDDRGGGTRLPVASQQRREVDVDQLVAVEREDVARLAASRGGEA